MQITMEDLLRVANTSTKQCTEHIEDLKGTLEAYQSKLWQINLLQNDGVYAANERNLLQEIHDFRGLLAQAEASYAELKRLREDPSPQIEHYTECVEHTEKQISLWSRYRTVAQIVRLAEKTAKIEQEWEDTD